MTEIIKVQKINEVYNRILCEDEGIRRDISDHFSFYAPNYQFVPSYRNRMWDGKLRLYDLRNNSLYSGLMHYLDEFVKTKNYILDFDYDISNQEFSLLEAQDFVLPRIKESKLSLGLRDYQIKAFIDGVRNRRQLFVCPTASGKSFIIYLLLRWYLQKTLIIVPTTTLVHQMYGDFQDYGFDSEKYVHKLYPGQSSYTDKPITIAIWNSIYVRRKKKHQFLIEPKWFKQFNVVIGDEAHEFQAKVLSGIMEKMVNAPYRFGFTGTLSGQLTHQLVLEGLFGPKNVVTTLKELQDSEHIAKFKIKIIGLSYEEKIRKAVKGIDYHQEMEFLTGYEPRNRFIKNLSISLKGNTLLLFQFVEKHGKILYEMIKKESKDRKIFFIHGSVSAEDRNEIRGIVEKEKDAIIVASYGTYQRGINIKHINNLIFASPSKSQIRILQSIGRSLRRSETKTSAVIFDIADDLSYNGKRNYTADHLLNRIELYNKERISHKIYNVGIK